MSPVSFAMHASVAIEMKRTPPKNRPCVIWGGGREPHQWEAYPNHRFLSLTGALDCCDSGGCWKSRAQKVGDGDKKDIDDLCLYPVNIGKDPVKEGKDLFIAKCLNMIEPIDIIRAVETYYRGGVLKYGSTINGGSLSLINK